MPKQCQYSLRETVVIFWVPHMPGSVPAGKALRECALVYDPEAVLDKDALRRAGRVAAAARGCSALETGILQPAFHGRTREGKM